ncbi:MAG: ribonucleoside-diphosphate reductase, adenosylcobalamin-dependent [Flavobacteriales bacterium]|nr:ribonucleoside-diphosphate reductase, adenosylcobalamin-dependent [Flavobacteriales bacterium]
MSHSYSDNWIQLLAYFQNDELAAKVWAEKYALKSSTGKWLEITPKEMHIRLAKEFFRIEKKYLKKDSKHEHLSEYGKERKSLTYDSIFDFFNGFKYLIPQGSVMANLGVRNQFSSLSNCVVVPDVFDSYGGILFTDQQLVQLYKRRCGVGLDISGLRPIHEEVKNSAATTSGAVSFMERFSNTTREVAQQGRRGALMITMDVRHPEILKFIHSKKELNKITGANISVKITNDFMRSVRENKNFVLQWPVDAVKPKYTTEVKAKDLWNQIINCAHGSGEPGVLFWDQQHAYSTSSIYPQYKNTSTNPCSEIAMQGGDSCRLMAINLYSFVDNPFHKAAAFNFEKLYEVAYEGMRLMDDLVDLEVEHIKKILSKIESDNQPTFIKDTEKRTWELLLKNCIEARRVGLGFTGLADALAALGIGYSSQDAHLKIDAIMRVKFQGEIDSTIDMAIQRGCFSGYNAEIEKQSDFVSKMMFLEFREAWERMQKYGRRNVSFSTVAPTGTLSLLSRTSSGIEPVYSLSYKRRKKVLERTPESIVDESGDCWEEFEVLHPKLMEWKKAHPKKSLEDSPYYGNTAHEINWEERIAIQKIVQKYTTHSISSTINLNSDVPVDHVKNIYLKAWEEGLKGITVYRDGSRDDVLVSTNKKEKIGERPKTLSCKVIRFKNEKENWIAVIGLLNDKPYEIFTGKINRDFNVPDYVSKGWVIKVFEAKEKRYDFQYEDVSGNSIIIEGLSRAFNSEYWNYAKLISGMLKLNIPIEQVVQLVEELNLYDSTINTWKNGVSRALRNFIKPGIQREGSICPSCFSDNALVYQDGCSQCIDCGFTECS